MADSRDPATKDFKVSRHLVRARAFLDAYAAYINPGMIEYMAQQLALMLIQENTSDVGRGEPPDSPEPRGE